MIAHVEATPQLKLSPALRHLESFPQFIVYRLTPPATPGAKWAKVPVNPKTLVESSAHNPANWMTHQAASAASLMLGANYRVGFVISPETGLFCLDIDGAHIAGVPCEACYGVAIPEGLDVPPNDLCAQCGGRGALKSIVRQVWSLLPRAGMERSVSGGGFHIWGRYEGTPVHGCTNKALGLELYTSGRFIALGDQSGAVGDAAADCTEGLGALIAQYFPPAAGGGKREWSDSADPEWSGPTDDAELIGRMVKIQSIASTFGSKASFKDLWEANEQALSVSYPDPLRAYDASSADAALAQHLAFYTGCDCARMERLMRRSALCRDKWDEREDYLERTILGAVANQGSVYNDQHYVDERNRRQEQIAKNLRISEGSEEHRTVEVLTLEQMLKRYLYITDIECVQDLENPRRIFSFSSFVKAHGASKTVVEIEGKLDDMGNLKTKSIPTAKLWADSPDLLAAPSITFRPGGPILTEDPDGNEAANTWRAIERVPPQVSDASLFLSHVGYLFGADAPRFLDWLAHIEQVPGKLPHTGWVHISPLHGTGRNWLASVLCRLWRGYVAPNFDLAGTLVSGFNGRLSHRLLAIVDEIDEGGSNARWGNAEALKSLVTTDIRPINPKYGHQRMEWNACRWLIFSNHTSALPLTESDRRFNVVSNEQPPMPSEYYARLYSALEDSDFIAAVAWMLKTRDIRTFNAGAPAQMNEAKREMIGASKSEADDVISHLIETHPADVITNNALASLLKGGNPSHHRRALSRAGVKAYGKAIRIGSVVTKVSILRNHEKWKNAPNDLVRAELIKGTGAPSPSFANFAAATL